MASKGALSEHESDDSGSDFGGDVGDEHFFSQQHGDLAMAAGDDQFAEVDLHGAESDDDDLDPHILASSSNVDGSDGGDGGIGDVGGGLDDFNKLDLDDTHSEHADVDDAPHLAALPSPPHRGSREPHELAYSPSSSPPPPPPPPLQEAEHTDTTHHLSHSAHDAEAEQTTTSAIETSHFDAFDDDEDVEAWSDASSDSTGSNNSMNRFAFDESGPESEDDDNDFFGTRDEEPNTTLAANNHDDGDDHIYAMHEQDATSSRQPRQQQPTPSPPPSSSSPPLPGQQASPRHASSPTTTTTSSSNQVAATAKIKGDDASTPPSKSSKSSKRRERDRHHHSRSPPARSTQQDADSSSPRDVSSPREETPTEEAATVSPKTKEKKSKDSKKPKKKKEAKQNLELPAEPPAQAELVAQADTPAGEEGGFVFKNLDTGEVMGSEEMWNMTHTVPRHTLRPAMKPEECIFKNLDTGGVMPLSVVEADFELGQRKKTTNPFGFKLTPSKKRGDNEDGDDRPDRMTGIGIVFALGPAGEAYIRQLTPGGPAARSTELKLGDVLLKINEKDVYCLPLEQLPPLVLGPKGSEVQLTLQRETARETASGTQRQVSTFAVKLIRDSLKLKPAKEGEVLVMKMSLDLRRRWKSRYVLVVGQKLCVLRDKQGQQRKELFDLTVCQFFDSEIVASVTGKQGVFSILDPSRDILFYFKPANKADLSSWLLAVMRVKYADIDHMKKSRKYLQEQAEQLSLANSSRQPGLNK